MTIGRWAARFALAAVCVLMTAMPADARFWQCVPYARMLSGVDIRGDAHTWWAQAAGRYERGSQPREGAVLAFESSRRMRLGHVAMVSKVVSEREVLLRHANWSRRGGIETDVRAVDVSPANDWSQVRVWYAPNGDLGTSTNPAHGFIYPDAAPAVEAPVRVVMAAAVPVAVSPAARAAAFTLADLDEAAR